MVRNEIMLEIEQAGGAVGQKAIDFASGIRPEGSEYIGVVLSVFSIGLTIYYLDELRKSKKNGQNNSENIEPPSSLGPEGNSQGN